MSTAAAPGMKPLDKKLRGKLEDAVKQARDVAEEAARAACTQLGVGHAKPDSHLSDEERDLRRRLHIHGRQLGDKRDPKTEEQEIVRLVEEIAYEHWHRMLFARFLAENQLLMYPDPDEPVAVSLEDCEDLAADEGASNGWELAARFAAKMLPQIFRVESPVFGLSLPPENQQQMEQLVDGLDQEVFTSSDALGWVYQYWQSKEKAEVNASAGKVGARELPAVTQLFTEPYMVSFLLDNSLGAWWAARRLSEDDLQNAESEKELRGKASLPGVSLEYLRFVRDEAGDRWRPAAGSFESWPESLSEFRMLDPCCGSGHFLVGALLMLVPMRMELEELSARDAIDRVIDQNLYGLEIDQRCVELAAFAVALSAWRYPESKGYRQLPELNFACSGMPISASKDEWLMLAEHDESLAFQLEALHRLFREAPSLGSLIDPTQEHSSQTLLRTDWTTVQKMLLEALGAEDKDELVEMGIVAHGLAKAVHLLCSKYTLVATNVPYLGQRDQSQCIRSYLASNHGMAKADLATAFLQRSLRWLEDGGTVQNVTPQNWLFLKTYSRFRKHLLTNTQWNLIARLGPQAFQTPMYDFNVQLLSITRARPATDGSAVHDWIAGIDASKPRTAAEKAELLSATSVKSIDQADQLENPDHVVSFEERSSHKPLSEYADCYQGASTLDIKRFRLNFWEVLRSQTWNLHMSTPSDDDVFTGISYVSYTREPGEAMHETAAKMKEEGFLGGWLSGNKAWGKTGVACSWMNKLPATPYYGAIYDNMAAVIVPHSPSYLPAIWAYCSSPDFNTEVRKLNQKVQVANATLVKVPFDLEHWSNVAKEKWYDGLPRPFSNDPTQWIFHGNPASSTEVLQVAVARLLGYRWPAELDEEMELATDARAWVKRSGELVDSADDDGIVCLPAVGSELPAEDRLLNLLHKSFEQGREQEQDFREKLETADEKDPVTVDLWRRSWEPSLPGSFNEWIDSLLEAAGHKGKSLGSWLRDKFFTQHCKLFQHRPFIWQIWDGLKDGFSVLVNYHKLDNKLLQTLIYTYLNDWIKQQQNQLGKVDGSQERLDAANALKAKLELILKGESPYDVFVRWKSLEEQSIGWNPDLNDGVRLNIRPWMTVGDVGKKGAGILRDKPNIHWKKDRGKDVESAPWYHLGPEYKGKEGDRINDHHLTLDEKKAARKQHAEEATE